MRTARGLRPAVAALFAASLLLGPTSARAEDPSGGYLELVGAMHEHSGYSDGWPGSTPAHYYASGKTFGLDFMAGSEHSDNADAPVTASEECIPVDLDVPPVPNDNQPAACVATDADSAAKWDATERQAREATVPGEYSAIRGFEWTSDRFGHINVYFSRNDANAKGDGGYATMESFYRWFTTRPELGGGSDGLATFNHPGDKDLNEVDGPLQTGALNWNDFAYVPAADDRMVGVELYNDDQEFGSRGPAPGWYVRALDKGWHVGAIGAEDLGHRPSDEWGSPIWGKTVILATENSPQAIRSALLARRFYALGPHANDRRLDFSVDGAGMGSRLARTPGTELSIVAGTTPGDGEIQVLTSGGAVVASGTGRVEAKVTASAEQRYYFMRVEKDGKWVAYGSPVWVSAGAAPPVGEWLAGDLHVHTCYSHDAYCPHRGDDNTGPDEFYTFSGDVDERFTEAELRGLDYLAITDHNDVRSVGDLAAAEAAHGVIGVPAYENSISGHAQMLGATKIYPHGDGADAINAMADALRGDGGIFQANHPADPTDNTFRSLDEECSDTSELHWKYGFDVRPDTVEIWNIGHVLQPPMLSGTSQSDAVQYWECWLQRGERVGATGGSDSHWMSTSAAQGPGNPTTWVFARERSAAGVLQALREGRTTISVTSPINGAVRLLLEADGDGDGTFGSIVGDAVAPNARMRVRAEGNVPPGGIVQVRANGETLTLPNQGVLLPGSVIEFDAPDAPGWVRATLVAPDGTEERRTHCDPVASDAEQTLPDELNTLPEPFPDDEPQQGTTYCRNPVAVVGMTSAIYLEEPDTVDPVTPTTLAYTGPTSAKGDTVDAAATLTTADGTPVAGKPVVFTIGQATASDATDADGVASTTLTVPDHGKQQTVHAAFAGDTTHSSSSASATITWGGGKK